MSPPLRTWCVVLLALAALAPAARAQVYVFPRQAGKSQVRNFEFSWQHVDLAFPVGPEAGDGGRVSLVTGRPPGLEVPLTESPDGGTAEAVDGDAGTAGDEGLAQAADGGVGEEGLAQGAADGGVVPQEGPQAEGGLPPARRVRYTPRPVPSGTGQVRLYFYERERAVTERAAAVIELGYQRLVERFRYVPRQSFPYILYSSYQEFLQTNLSPVQEGTLGFTSPLDLTLSLPYFGDDRLFELVSTHELAHQFTIQKVRTVATAAGVQGEPLGRMPLWFIEGLAEYAAQGGMDPEADMLIRDLVINPDFQRGYVLGDFFQQGPGNFLWIYKMGQARCAFLDETYGDFFVQRVLDESWRLVGRGNAPGMEFPQLLERLTGEKASTISARFERWLKRRGYRNYLGAEQDVPSIEPLQGVPEYMDALNASPNGQLLMVRSFDPSTGQVMLQLLDVAAPGHHVTVAKDGVPGVESLNLVFGRNFDLTDERLVFVAGSGGRDVLYVQDFQHERRRGQGQLQPPPQLGGAATAGVGLTGPLTDARIHLQQRREFHLAPKGVLAAFSPSLSPDGREVVFAGLAEEGTRDLFILEVESGKVRRLTQTPYTERQVHWGRSGILFTSDATEHRRFNIFRLDPARPDAAPERLTVEERDHFDPQELSGGRIFFTSYSEGGRANLYEAVEGELLRRTDIATGLFDTSPGGDSSVWALLHRNGRRQPVYIQPRHLRVRETVAMGETNGIPLLERNALTGAVPYRPFSWENIDLGPIFGFGGAAPNGIYGQLYAVATDKLKNHGAILQVAVYGNWELTDGILLYLNQERQLTWGGGLFQSLRFRTDRTNEDVPFINYERFYGVRGLARHPFNTFMFLEGEAAVGGASYFVTEFTREVLANPAFRNELGVNVGDTDFYATWRNRTGGARLQTEVVGRFGFDTLRYDFLAGPIDGSSLLVEASANWQPTTQQVFGNVRLDAAQYFHLISRISLLTQLGLGSTYGGYFARDFFLSSYDTIRGAPFGDQEFLVGRHYLYSTAELQVPLNMVVAVAFLNNIEGVVGADFGGVGDSARDAWNHRVLNFVAGVNLGLGPLMLRLHFARPFNIGAAAGLPVPEGQWVTNFSLGLLGMPGFFRDTHANTRPQGMQGPYGGGLPMRH